jgi:hypothetical protein
VLLKHSIRTLFQQARASCLLLIAGENTNAANSKSKDKANRFFPELNFMVTKPLQGLMKREPPPFVVSDLRAAVDSR